MIHTVTLNPAIDKTVVIPYFHAGAVNRISSMRVDAGGKGINVARVIRNLGGDSMAWGIMGMNGGSVITTTLEKEGITHQFLPIDGDVRVNLKIVDPQQKCNTDINESGCPVNMEVLDTLIFQIESAIKPDDIVVLTGSLPPQTHSNLYGEWIKRLKKKRIRVFLDADRDAFRIGIRSKPFLIKPNRRELEQLQGETDLSLTELQTAARDLVAGGIQNVVISLGSEGALYVNSNECLRAEALNVAVKSTVGAGDAMTAALALGLANGMTFRDTVALSIAVSAAKVMCEGSNPPERESVDMLLSLVHIETL